MDFKECIEYITKWYLSDTVDLLDLVLADDEKDPQYSAITTLNRFWVYFEYKRSISKENTNINSLLKELGYTKEELAKFKEKVKKEKPIYTSVIMDEDFIKE